MDIRTLRYVEAVARLGSFTGAARELHVAQPAVSTAVAQAERELGTPLFVRAHHRTTATEAGALVAASARRVQAELDDLRAQVDALRGVVSGTIRIGATPLLGRLDLTGLVAELYRRHPGLAITVRTGLVDPLLRDLADARLDVVLGPIPARIDPSLQAARLQEERVVLIVSPTLEPPPEHLADVAGLPFVCLGAQSGLRRILDEAAAAAGFTARVPFEVATPAQIREFVSSGLGVALVAESVAAGPGEPVTVCETGLDHPPIGVVTRRGSAHPPTSALLAVIADKQSP